MEYQTIKLVSFTFDELDDVPVNNLREILVRTMTSSINNLHGEPDRETETEITSQLTVGWSGRGLPPDKLS